MYKLELPKYIKILYIQYIFVLKFADLDILLIIDILNINLKS